jgi:hypothetical protein
MDSRAKLAREIDRHAAELAASGIFLGEHGIPIIDADSYSSCGGEILK